MSPTTIENPVINSPFIEPARHFRTTADGSVTGEIEPRRRPSEFFVPVARPKKTSGQLTLDAYGPPARQLVVEIRGLDVYDPTTGEIRSSSTDDIACWFIDTMYNGESFFVRHAYFTGADEPYEKLQRALRAEIDEAAWQSLYSAQSMPFDAPATGKIAVKVINHYGDEVLKVYSVDQR